MKYWGVASQWTGIPHREHSEYSQLLYAMKTRINSGFQDNLTQVKTLTLLLTCSLKFNDFHPQIISKYWDKFP